MQALREADACTVCLGIGPQWALGPREDCDIIADFLTRSLTA